MNPRGTFDFENNPSHGAVFSAVPPGLPNVMAVCQPSDKSLGYCRFVPPGPHFCKHDPTSGNGSSFTSTHPRDQKNESEWRPIPTHISRHMGSCVSSRIPKTLPENSSFDDASLDS